MSAKISFASHAAYWNTAIEPITLGGLLCLRLELEYYLEDEAATWAEIYFDQRDLESSAHLIQEVVGSSSKKIIAQPFESQKVAMIHPERTYLSYAGITDLARQTQRRPILSWNSSIEQRMQSIPQPFFTILLKGSGRDDPEDSNSEVSSWEAFFDAVDTRNRFILLGPDPINYALAKRENISWAQDLGLSLSEQLCLVHHSQGFLGMASGICQSAIFSSIPYAIFKHPKHHAEEIEQELMGKRYYPFSGPNQYVNRMTDTTTNLLEAFHGL